LLKLVLKNTR